MHVAFNLVIAWETMTCSGPGDEGHHGRYGADLQDGDGGEGMHHGTAGLLVGLQQLGAPGPLEHSKCCQLIHVALGDLILRV